MTKPSWLFWVVAVLAVIWNAFAVYDYWMTSTGDEKYLRDFDPGMIDWIRDFPFWRKAMWAIAVVAGLLGALALLARRRVAVALLLANCALIVLGFAGHDILLADGANMYGQLGLVMSFVIVGVAAFEWLYADRAARQGYLA